MKRKTEKTALLWLEWPEACFRLDAASLGFFRTLVPPGTRVVRARSEAAFLKALPQATLVVTWHFRREGYAVAKNLRTLATPGAGRELVCADAPAGVRVHFGGFQGAIMAETVAAFALGWARGMFRPERQLPWGRTALGDKCRCVAGTRAVVVGYGRVGRAIGAKLAALGVSVFGYSRRLGITARELDRELKRADWLVLALPSDTGTDDWLDARRIAKLSRRCVVINVGRGNAIDEEALLAALRGGRLAGACLDVFKGEPGPLQEIVRSREGGGILAAKPSALPWNLVRLPHASAFADDYLIRCFRELKDEKLV